MKISYVAPRGIAGLQDMTVDLMSGSGRPHDLVLVTGPEASGKTRFLELILAGLEAIGPYEGIVRSEDWVDEGGTDGQVELGIWLGETELGARTSAARTLVTFGADGATSDAPRALARLVSRYDHDPSHGKREYFHDGRQPAWGARRDGLGALEQSLWRCSKDPQKYSFIGRFLSELERDPVRARAFSEGLASLAEGVRYRPAPDDPEACFSSHGGLPVRLAELASAEADGAIIAATAALIGLHHSIVLLDRPERYVAPERVVAWVRALAELGNDNQWIIATSEPRLAASVDPAQLVSMGPLLTAVPEVGA